MCLGWQFFLQSNLSKATPYPPPPFPPLKKHKCKHACRVQLTLTELYWRSCQYFAKSCKVSFTVSDKTGITHWSSKFSYRIMSHEAVTSCTQCMALFLQSNPCSTNIYISRVAYQKAVSRHFDHFRFFCTTRFSESLSFMLTWLICQKSIFKQILMRTESKYYILFAN